MGRWIQSPLAPASAQAAELLRLGSFFFWIAAAVYLVVVGFLLYAAFRRRPPAEGTGSAVGSAVGPAGERRMRNGVVAAVGLTAVTLFLYLVLSFSTGRALTAPVRHPAATIAVTGYQWWWDVEYEDSIPQRRMHTANEIHIPVGRPVLFKLTARDVIHSFWVPNLSGKKDLIPGDMNTLWFQADTAGVYRGQCAEFCGYQHAKMAFVVVAESPERYATWLEQQRDTARTPADSVARRGQEVFLSSACVMCHTIQGTPAGSRVGPDLTHVASRRTLAAGTLSNTRGNLAGWIIDPQRIKPGARMPSNQLTPGDLQALLAYLGSLR